MTLFIVCAHNKTMQNFTNWQCSVRDCVHLFKSDNNGYHSIINEKTNGSFTIRCSFQRSGGSKIKFHISGNKSNPSIGSFMHWLYWSEISVDILLYFYLKRLRVTFKGEESLISYHYTCSSCKILRLIHVFFRKIRNGRGIQAL